MELSNQILAIVALVVSVLVVPIVNLIKHKVNWKDKKALWLTFGSCVVVAVVVAWVANAFVVVGQVDPEDIIAMIGIVFTIATLLFKSIAKEVPDLPQLDGK